jgi:hypothetical protein
MSTTILVFITLANFMPPCENYIQINIIFIGYLIMFDNYRFYILEQVDDFI